MSEAPKSSALKPAGLPDGKTEDNAPVNVDAILQSIRGRGGERFGMAAAVLRGERIIAQRLQKAPPVPVILENLLPVVAPRHHVIHTAPGY
jgi:hypothetical protein